uniref:Uncharacterized protein n=1 Tax=Strigamia maritima TaxID=126957 RepID=T1IXX1_STRMM
MRGKELIDPSEAEVEASPLPVEAERQRRRAAVERERGSGVRDAEATVAIGKERVDETEVAAEAGNATHRGREGSEGTSEVETGPGTRRAEVPKWTATKRKSIRILRLRKRRNANGRGPETEIGRGEEVEAEVMTGSGRRGTAAGAIGTGITKRDPGRRCRFRRLRMRESILMDQLRRMRVMRIIITARIIRDITKVSMGKNTRLNWMITMDIKLSRKISMDK